jgi:hypothetical protein
MARMLNHPAGFGTLGEVAFFEPGPLEWYPLTGYRP